MISHMILYITQCHTCGTREDRDEHCFTFFQLPTSNIYLPESRWWPLILKWIVEAMLFVVVPVIFIFQSVEMIDGLIQMLGDMSEWIRHK